jgi:hypothetical protein
MECRRRSAASAAAGFLKYRIFKERAGRRLLRCAAAGGEQTPAKACGHGRSAIPGQAAFARRANASTLRFPSLGERISTPILRARRHERTKIRFCARSAGVTLIPKSAVRNEMQLARNIEQNSEAGIHGVLAPARRRITDTAIQRRFAKTLSVTPDELEFVQFAQQLARLFGRHF